jgi:hypothetical protein
MTARTSIALVIVVGLLCPGCPGGGSDGAANVPMGARAAFDGLSFEVPAAWTSEQPSSNMRVAQYRIAPASGDPEPGECTLFHFPGQGGSVQANLERWYGQFTQPDGGSTAAKARVENFSAGGLRVTLVEVAGTYSGGMDSTTGPKPGYMLVAGVVETSEAPWFLKCTGPQATMATAAPAVRALLATVKP